MGPLLLQSSLDRNYVTTSVCKGCTSSKEKIVLWPRGKVMGGSSSIGSMWYVRGNKHDYDYWGELGNIGWSSADMLRYFMKSEDTRDPKVSCKLFTYLRLLIYFPFNMPSQGRIHFKNRKNANPIAPHNFEIFLKKGLSKVLVALHTFLILLHNPLSQCGFS